VSVMALTERVHSDGAIPPGHKCFLLMYGQNMTAATVEIEAPIRERVEVKLKDPREYLVEPTPQKS